MRIKALDRNLTFDVFNQFSINHTAVYYTAFVYCYDNPLKLHGESFPSWSLRGPPTI